MAFDSINIGRVGSILKVIIFIPLFFALLDLKSLSVHISPLFVTQILFVCLAVTSLFYTIEISRSLTSCITLILNITLIVVIGMMENYSDSEIKMLSKALVFSGWITVVLMLAFSDFKDGRLTMRIGSVAQDQNYINGYILAAFSYHINELISNKKKLHFIPAAILIVVVMLTGSRGALLAYFAAGMVCFVLAYRKERNFAKRVMVLILAVCILIAVFLLVIKILPDEVAYRFTIEYLLEKGTIGRTATWKTLLQHYKSDNLGRLLFGHGYGTTPLLNTYNHMVAHNLYIDNLMTLGAVGCLLQIAMQLQTLYILFKQKNVPYLGLVFVGYMVMCMSLSLLAYKPIWNMMLMALIFTKHNSKKDFHHSELLFKQKVN